MQLSRRLGTAVPHKAMLLGAALSGRCPPCAAVPLLHQRRTVAHTSPPRGPPPTPPQQQKSKDGGSPSSNELPSLAPLVAELKNLITRSMPVGELMRALTPEARKTLVAHRLPLEELLLHLPRHFLLYRSLQNNNSGFTSVHVAPPYLSRVDMDVMRLPAGTRPLPAVELWLGAEAAKAESMACAEVRGAAAGAAKVGLPFVGRDTTVKEQLEEVLSYIPNEWVPFSKLDMPRHVKMRCMGYPETRPFHFFAKYPQLFETRQQNYPQFSFFVRRSPLLQEQLKNQSPKP